MKMLKPFIWAAMTLPTAIPAFSCNKYTHGAVKTSQNVRPDIIKGQRPIFDDKGIREATAILQRWFLTVL